MNFSQLIIWRLHEATKNATYDAPGALIKALDIFSELHVQAEIEAGRQYAAALDAAVRRRMAKEAKKREEG